MTLRLAGFQHFCARFADAVLTSWSPLTYERGDYFPAYPSVKCEGCGNAYADTLVQPCYTCRLAEREAEEEVAEPAHICGPVTWSTGMDAWVCVECGVPQLLRFSGGSGATPDHAAGVEASPTPAPGEMCRCGHVAYCHDSSGCSAPELYRNVWCDCTGFQFPSPEAADAPAASASPAPVDGTPPASPGAGLSFIDYMTPAIWDVLAVHMPTRFHVTEFGANHFHCECGYDFQGVADGQTWREHVGPLIAERIERAGGKR